MRFGKIKWKVLNVMGIVLKWRSIFDILIRGHSNNDVHNLGGGGSEILWHPHKKEIYLDESFVTMGDGRGSKNTIF
jgi:hypothetical protein